MWEEVIQEIQTWPVHKRFTLVDAVFCPAGHWTFMLAVFGMLSIFVIWLQAKTSDNDLSEIVKQQRQPWLYIF